MWIYEALFQKVSFKVQCVKDQINMAADLMALYPKLVANHPFNAKNVGGSESEDDLLCKKIIST